MADLRAALRAIVATLSRDDAGADEADHALNVARRALAEEAKLSHQVATALDAFKCGDTEMVIIDVDKQGSRVTAVQAGTGVESQVWAEYLAAEEARDRRDAEAVADMHADMRGEIGDDDVD